MVVHLTEPYNNTFTTNSSIHYIPANFTWNPQTLTSIQSSHVYVNLQIIPIRGLINILKGIQGNE